MDLVVIPSQQRPQTLRDSRVTRTAIDLQQASQQAPQQAPQ